MEGMTELQALHNMREILNERAANQRHNENINKKWNEAALAKCTIEGNASKIAEQIFNQELNFKSRIFSILLRLIVPAVILIVGIIVGACISGAISGEMRQDGIGIFLGWAAWLLIAIALVAGFNIDFFDLNFEDFLHHFITIIVCAVGCVVAIFCFGSGYAFWQVLLILVCLLLWPVVSLFTIAEASWWILLVVLGFFGFLAASIAVALHMNDTNMENYAMKDLKVKRLKQEFDSKYNIWNNVYNEIRNQLANEFQSQMLIDITEQKMSLYNDILPQKEQDFKTIVNLIWCIENRYANTIVEARQFLYLKSTIDKYLGDMKVAQDRAAKERERMIKKCEEFEREKIDAINAMNKEQVAYLNELKKQGDKRQETLEGLARTAKNIEIDTSSIANSSERAAQDISRAHEYIRKNI